VQLLPVAQIAGWLSCWLLEDRCKTSFSRPVDRKHAERQLLQAEPKPRLAVIPAAV
jgi:hypothetical protein